MRLTLSLDRPQLSSHIKYIFMNLCGFERIYNHSHCFSGIMKIGFSFLIKTLMSWADFDIRYLTIDCLDKHLHHPLNGICKLRDGNFAVCQFTGQARSNPEWPGLSADVVTEGKTAAFPRGSGRRTSHTAAVLKEKPPAVSRRGLLFKRASP